MLALELLRNLLQVFKDNGNKLPCDTEVTATIDPSTLATEATLSSLKDARGSGALNLGNGDMSGNITSAAIALGGSRHLSITLHAASATHVGTVAVQTSDDGTNWNAETLSSTPTAASGSAFDARIDLETTAAFARIIYTAGSGAGTLTGTYTLKE